jgi:hypothetical protein
MSDEKITDAMEMEKTNKYQVKQKIINVQIPVKKMPQKTIHKDSMHTFI